MSFLFQAVLGILPEPTIYLYWGDDISKEDMIRFKENNETGLLFNKDGVPCKFIIWADELRHFRESDYSDKGINYRKQK